MKLYCQQCGSPHEYTLKKPNFCQNCGDTLSKMSAAAVIKEKIVPKAAVVAHDDDDDDEDDGSQVPDIQGLEFDSDATPIRGIKLGSVVGTSSGEKVEPDSSPKISKKDMIEEYKREAGSLRPSGRTRKNK